MNKKEKIACLENAMTRSRRDENDENSEFYHFTDDAPRELTDLFLKHYEVRDVDYETFSDACNIMSELLTDSDIEDVEEAIYERACDCASYYNATRLEYLNIWNQDEASEYIRDGIAEDIAQASAIWYDKQVEQMCFIILEWVNE